MKNFNKKFKSRPLKTIAWRLCKANNAGGYDQATSSLRIVNFRALEWLHDVGVPKYVIRYSPILRFGVVTSNHVESVNSVLKEARCLLVLDCLLEIGYYIGKKYFQSTQASGSWSCLTKNCNLAFDKSIRKWSSLMTLQCNSPLTSIVTARDPANQSKPRQFAASLSPFECSCGRPTDMLSPCDHLLFAIHSLGRSPVIESYYHHTWTTSTFRLAYPAHGEEGVQPLTVVENTFQGNCAPPKIEKKRGRPKKHRYESQSATLELNKTTKMVGKCGICQDSSHNRRTCSSTQPTI